MNPTNEVNPNNPTFSPCSSADICSVAGMATCLKEPGTHTVLNGGICGNGVVEGTEQCDCGGKELCVGNACCFDNCTLKAGAFCSDDNHACCEDCNIVSKDVIKLCRNSSSECDVAEYCSGQATCPKDTFRPDGIVCGNSSDTKCASGICTNRKLQCKAYGGADLTGDCSAYSGTLNVSVTINL
jgi:Disintegrin